MLPPDFSWTTYLLLNPDVAQTSLTKSFAESHYRKYGSREKRKYKSYHPSMIFDWKFYIFHTPELKWLKNEEQAFRHYFLTGRKKTYLNNANRIILINYLIDRYRFKSYLEIGCEKDLCFNVVRAEHKVGVDPIEGGTHRMTSDEFFSTNTETFDIIFIDGLHWSEQVFRDITNSLKSLNQGGIIVVHDCNPPEEIYNLYPRPLEQKEWNGDVWKAFISFRQDPDLDMVTGNFDWGCGVIRVLPNTDQLVLEKSPFQLTYDDFERNRKTWLRLLTFDQLVSWLDKGDSVLKKLTSYQQDQDILDEKEITNSPKPDLK